MKYALFLGCTVPARARNYELSARKVAEKVGIELVDITDFICCGFPIKASDEETSLIMAAYNLCLAEQKGLDICVLCSSCGSALVEAGFHLNEDRFARDRVNRQLSRVGMKYEGKSRVRHLARILFEEIGAEKIRPFFEKDAGSLEVAVHYGCHYLKPSKIFEGFDSVEDPRSIDALVEITGAGVISYPGKKNCCGGPILPVDERVALSLAKNKLDNISSSGANAICLVCPFCSVMLDGNQKSIESEYGVSFDIPVLYLTQILGLAMGFDRKELGLNMNVVKTKALLIGYFE